MPVRLALALVSTVSLALVADAQNRSGGRGAGQGGGFDFRALIVGAADADGDGSVSAEEWQAFTRGLDLDGELDRATLKARVLAPSLDRDGDRKATVGELTEVLAALDTDGDGNLQASELSARGARRGLALGVVLRAADADEDGEVSAAELAALLEAAGAGPEEPVSEAALAAWAMTVQSRSSEDRTAFTPSVMLLSIDGALDANLDGSATPADLELLFASFDANGDGTVEAGELRPQRGGQGRGGAGSGGESFRQADADQRAKPPLIEWQRNLDDALELVKRTGKPLLICVNMDGEPASEALSWFRYRDPEFARLTEGFVALVVSPDRHTPIDHDDRGRRVADPRFGRVIEREHIDLEPLLYERYFDGTRVAPRHLGVSPAGEKLFDIYLTNELTLIDQALSEHGRPVAAETQPVEPRRADPLDSPDAGDRERLEAGFATGDWRVRFRLASRALDSARFAQHPEILRMALRDPDGRVRRQAVWTVVREPGRLDQELVGEAFRASAEDASLRGALAGAFRRLARLTEDQTERARAERLQAVFEGLARSSSVVDAARWRQALDGAEGFDPRTPSAEELDPLIEELADLDAQIATTSEDLAPRMRRAEALRQLARVLLATGQDPSVALEEARGAGQAAEAAGDRSGRAAAIQCWASYQLGEMDAAATDAARALPRLVPQAASLLALDTLHSFGQVRMRQVYDALRAETAFESQWVADVRDAYEVLLAHPGGTEQQAVEALGFLSALDARAEQGDLARRAVARFPLSSDVHAWVRGIVLRDEGAAALEATYDALVPPEDGEAVFRWYAGLAALVAAERQVGNRDAQAALASYARCVERMRASMAGEPVYADTALHYVCLACAGQARLHAEAERWDEAAAALREGLEGRPQSASTEDGLGNSPAQTATLVLRGLTAAGLTDAAAELREALDAAGVEPTRRTQGE